MIHDLRVAGWSPEEVADGLEISLATVYRHLGKLRHESGRVGQHAAEVERYRAARRECGIELEAG